MSTTQQLLSTLVETPIGEFIIVANEQGELCMTGFTDSHPRVHRTLARYADDPNITLSQSSQLTTVESTIESYFAGELHALDAIAVAASGSEFQHSVWYALRQIPCGQTCSYGELAKQLGKPGAARAVGLANGSNPMGVIVPCHRVIGANGTLTGYGGGLQRKQWLLKHEGCDFRAKNESKNTQIDLFAV